MERTPSCLACGVLLLEDEEHVQFARGRWRIETYCSESCLRKTVNARRRARDAVRRRWFLGLSLAAIVAAGAHELWLRIERLRPQRIAFEPPAPALYTLPPRSPVPVYGPRWPPSDEEWTALFSESRWVYPLPGPVRRDPTTSAEIFGPAPPKDRAAVCRPSGHCAVDLGGELWGEHVYAAQDGVVDHIQRDGTDERGGAYVRLAHFGGFVFTHYFHLAGIPRTLSRGAAVKAGDLIGLVGDTGTGRPSRHLTFALSILPSRAFAETYWDPEPWMAAWPLHVPKQGTVAGFAPERKAEIHAGGRRRAEPRGPLSSH